MNLDCRQVGCVCREGGILITSWSGNMIMKTTHKFTCWNLASAFDVVIGFELGSTVTYNDCWNTEDFLKHPWFKD